MAAPIAKQGDSVVGTDIHIVLVPTAGGPVPTPLPHPFSGKLQSALATTVKVAGMAAATLDSIAQHQPPHIPAPPGTAFQTPPKNQGTVMLASQTVKLAGKGAARAGDMVKTCNDPSDLPAGSIIAAGTVLVGG